MTKIYFHAEVYEGVTRVQAGPFGQVLQREPAICIARAVISLANGESSGLGRVLFACPASRIEATNDAFRDLEVLVGPDVRGTVARLLGFGSRRIQISEVPLDRLAEVLELCWEHAPLFFGVPAKPSHVEGAPPDLSTVTPSVEYLKQWRSFGHVFHHGEWVAFSADHVAHKDLLATVMACFRDGGWEGVVSKDPM